MKKKVKATSEIIYWKLRNDIIHRKFPGGMSLIEDELAENYNVSRTPVREAVKRLESDGLVICYPYCGSFVKEFSEKDLIDIFTVRKALEGINVYIATEMATQENLRIIQDNQERSWNAFEENDVELSNKLSDKLHKAIRMISNNMQIEAIYQSMSGPQEYFKAMTVRMDGRMKRSLEEHDAIIDAMRKKNGKLAELRMRDHIDSTMKEVLKFYRDAKIDI